MTEESYQRHTYKYSLDEDPSLEHTTYVLSSG